MTGNYLPVRNASREASKASITGCGYLNKAQYNNAELESARQPGFGTHG